MSRRGAVPNPVLAAALAKAMKSSRDLRTQGALARESGVAQSTIGRILRGECDPQSANLARIARALRIPLASLVEVPPVESSNPGQPVEPDIDARDRQYDKAVVSLQNVQKILRRFETEIARWRGEAGL